MSTGGVGLFGCGAKEVFPAGSSLGSGHAGFLECFPVLEGKVAVESLQV